MINYTIEHHCSDNTRVQSLLNTLCGYKNNISLKIQHRGRINLFFALLNKLKKKNNIKTTHALDIGCSSGYYSQLMFEFGFNNVVGIDLSSKGIETVTNLYGTDSDKGKVSFLLENAETFQSNTKFDCILCTEVIEHTSNPEKVIENIYNLLAPQGVAIISIPNRISWSYFVEFIAYKLKKKPFNQEFIDHLNFPFYKSIRLFKSKGCKIIKTAGSNSLLDPLSMRILYKTFLFKTINTFNFQLSRLFPLKYFSQFFYIIIQKD